MRTVPVPRADWVRTFNELVAAREGWLISVEVLSSEMGAQPEITNLPLLGVSVDGTDPNSTILISAARAGTDHITHTIQGVSRVFIERTDEGAAAALQIESADGTRTILRFRSAALPETVDGVPER